MLNFYFFLFFAISFNKLVADTIVVVPALVGIDFISLSKIGKYQRTPRYGTVTVLSANDIINNNVAIWPVGNIESIIFTGHGDPGIWGAIYNPNDINVCVTNLIANINLANGPIRVLSCDSASRVVGPVPPDPSITDGVIDGLVAAGNPNLVVTVDGNEGSAITNVFDGVNDIIRICRDANLLAISNIQKALMDTAPMLGIAAVFCNALVPAAPDHTYPGIPRTLHANFAHVGALAKHNLANYGAYLSNNPNGLTIPELADLTYYNQGVRDFYAQLIQESDAALPQGYLLPNGQGLFRTTYDGGIYNRLPSCCLTREEYVLGVKDGNPPSSCCACCCKCCTIF